MKQSSAQLTVHYEPNELIGRQVLAVVNLPPRRIAGFVSEVLTLGVPDEAGRWCCCGSIFRCQRGADVLMARIITR